jgi:hypothetical protein
MGAIARPVQSVAWCGGAAQSLPSRKRGANATTRAVVSAAMGALPSLRVVAQ